MPLTLTLTISRHYADLLMMMPLPPLYAAYAIISLRAAFAAAYCHDDDMPCC